MEWVKVTEGLASAPSRPAGGPAAAARTWPVEEPSKFHTRSSATLLGTASSVMVFERRSWPLPPIQTYSACTREPCGRLM